jgi:hypothetical protein
MDWKADLLDLRARVGRLARVTSALNEQRAGETHAEVEGDAGIGQLRIAAVVVAAVYGACATAVLVLKDSSQCRRRSMSVSSSSHGGDDTDTNDDEGSGEDCQIMILEEVGAPRLPPCRWSAESRRSDEGR